MFRELVCQSQCSIVAALNRSERRTFRSYHPQQLSHRRVRSDTVDEECTRPSRGPRSRIDVRILIRLVLHQARGSLILMGYDNADVQKVEQRVYVSDSIRTHNRKPTPLASGSAGID